MGRNTHHCVSTVGVSLSGITVAARKLPKAWSVYNNVWLTDNECEKLKLIDVLLVVH